MPVTLSLSKNIPSSEMCILVLAVLTELVSTLVYTVIFYWFVDLGCVINAKKLYNKCHVPETQVDDCGYL